MPACRRHRACRGRRQHRGRGGADLGQGRGPGHGPPHRRRAQQARTVQGRRRPGRARQRHRAEVRGQAAGRRPDHLRQGGGHRYACRRAGRHAGARQGGEGDARTGKAGPLARPAAALCPVVLRPGALWLVRVVLNVAGFAAPVAAEYHADAVQAGPAVRLPTGIPQPTTRHKRGGRRSGGQPGPQGARQYGEWRGRGIPAAMAAQDRGRNRPR
ncbi:conserved protein of unknown function [Cupriavidus neocaledonicus]|uniref:Uncharacterized protein n=1 Tax=Cupriavidus neocaledonicus TaxID=1040979 RepID=A0A375H4Q7_9BURK|nr:hypothetical protein CBM2605_A60525 [Cupriavidus neocaledonicus]SPD45858.1 conserved protein of unknown function [Cupriavidus neocaledonicus]